ncbi:RTA1-domain-containing protein [Westerdykella ornata]|uniref:RTA1-domain-containing protein n=1 Tax=Westerdykella ornata TaxID=318751 RepID=A0A6A6JQR2_WESOR|nr:RTA1-domain-containing protein [Westerdykella ornata]KAF2278443.1 RTA1-domain-containing protein [Westerdykella ornata]
MTTENGLYPYKPSRPGTVIFAIAFGTSAAIHLYQMIRGRAWFYSSFTVGAVMMAAGYAARYVSTRSPADLGPFIAQSLFIILPPSLYAATIYMIYGRLVIFVNAAEASIIRPIYVTKIFVCGDVLAFVLQAAGGGMMAQVNLGDLGQKRLRHSSARTSVPQYGRHAWTALLKLMLGAAVVIILRCVFRIVEFAQGHAGYLASHEVYMYLFDTLPMLGVQLLFHFVRADSVFGANQVEKLGDRDSIIHLYERR